MTKNFMLESPAINKRPWFLVASVIALLIVSVLSVYFELETRGMKGEISQYEEKKAALIEAQKADSSDAALLAGGVSLEKVRAAVTQIRTQQLPWAKIIEKIENSIPKDPETRTPIVQFRSYNASAGGEIAVSALTRAGRLSPFDDVAEVIATFSSDPSFKNVFVPSITKSIVNQEGIEGAIVLSFSMTLKYRQQATGNRQQDEVPARITVPVPVPLAPKVPVVKPEVPTPTAADTEGAQPLPTKP